MVARLPVTVGTEVDADLLNEISGVQASASFLTAASIVPLVSAASTKAVIASGSFDFVSGYAYEISVQCRFSFTGATSLVNAEPVMIASLSRVNAAGTEFFASGVMAVTPPASLHHCSASQIVKCTAGDTTQTICFLGQYVTNGTGATALNINVNGSTSPARLTIKRIGLAASHSDAVEIPTS